jgi:Fur family ferric uptake transcriptional regulator
MWPAAGRMTRAPKKRTKAPRGAASISDFKAEIRRQGMRGTGSRVAVLAHLTEATGPLSHTEIHEALVDRGYDRATIYRNLTDLAEAGLLVRSDLGDHVWRFERKHAGGDHRARHPHFVCFVCVDCGGVSCLPADALQVKPSSRAPRALRTKQVEVHVKGRCDACG